MPNTNKCQPVAPAWKAETIKNNNKERMCEWEWSRDGRGERERERWNW